jgi:hypothetical protein
LPTPGCPPPPENSAQLSQFTSQRVASRAAAL